MTRRLVIMPALNEAQSIAVVIAEVRRDLPRIDQIDILVINDGLIDRTAVVALAGFFGWHCVSSGQFSPHIWAGFLRGQRDNSPFFYRVSFMTFWLGQIAEMIARMRDLQEHQLCPMRKHLEPTAEGA